MGSSTATKQFPAQSTNTAPAVMVGSRSWSTLCAKKQTLRRQPAPSLHSCRQQGMSSTWADTVWQKEHCTNAQVAGLVRTLGTNGQCLLPAGTRLQHASKPSPAQLRSPAPPACDSGWGAASTQTRHARRCRRHRACRCPATRQGRGAARRAFKFPAGKAPPAHPLVPSAPTSLNRRRLADNNERQHARQQQLAGTAGRHADTTARDSS